MLTNFVKNLFPKVKHVDWVIVKKILILVNQNAQILGIRFWKSFLRNKLTDASALRHHQMKIQFDFVVVLGNKISKKEAEKLKCVGDW